ncbi:MAG: PAS domain S-box protein [Burkholderiales bacterium]|nr:PAS domain S-box protein [Burkholderiales bacterium]
MKLSLRAKFLILGGVVQALVVCLLIWNSLRLLDDAVNQNALRVAREYAVTLNLSLAPYAQDGRLAQLQPFLSEMISSPKDSYVRYLAVVNSHNEAIFSVGFPPQLSNLFSAHERAQANNGLVTKQLGPMLHASTPFLLRGSEVGALHFGISTDELNLMRNHVLKQSGAIALVGFALGLVLLYLLTRDIGRRLRLLYQHSNRLAQGEYGVQLPHHGDDEIATFTKVMNRMSTALHERISQLENSERRLAESETRFKTLFNLAPVPLTVTDPSGKLIGVNLALTRVFGYQAEDVLGKTTAEFNFWQSFEERHRIWQTLRQAGSVTGEIATAVTADGRAVELAVWSSALEQVEGNAIIWALLDLTEELQAKRELKDLNTSLEERVKQRASDLEKANAELFRALDTLKRTQNDLVTAEKMASLGSLVAGVAHELNTPIGNSLLMATALHDRVHEFEMTLNENGLKRSTLFEYLEDTKNACKLMVNALQKAGNLIASFKQVAVDQTNDRRRDFDLKVVLRDTLTTFAPRLQRTNCSSTLEAEDGLLMDSYPGSLCQIIDNLINNALLHAFEGRSNGHIRITARALDAQQVELCLIDDGIGMLPDVLHHVFDPFFTTKMGQGGTGLGMHIVYNIVTGILGGHIEIESSLGQGSKIIMTFPRKAPQHDIVSRAQLELVETAQK